MKTNIYVPSSLRDAAKFLRTALGRRLSMLPKREFMAAWCSLAYLYPGLHPDGYRHNNSGWPRILKQFAAEAWRRARAGKLAGDELYCSDAAWAGLYDRMTVHHPDETERRLELAKVYGRPANA